MRFKVVAFAPNDLAHLAASFLELSNLAQGSFFLSMSQLVSQGFDPLRERRFLFPVQSPSQSPQMFAAVIKVQEFQRVLPAILLQVPHPFGSIAQVEQLAGAPSPSRKASQWSRRPSSIAWSCQLTTILSVSNPRPVCVWADCSCR